MQTSRPNGGSRRTQARSVSPLDGPPRSPLAATRLLTTQLGSMSVNSSSMGKGTLVSSPASKNRGLVHKKSKSMSSGSASAPSRGRSSDSSPVKAGHNTGHNKSTRTSPMKPQPSRSSSGNTSSHARTPSRSQAAAMLSKSAGPSTTATSRDSLIAAGGLGRMDIATKDWDGLTGSGSAGSSPQKRRPPSMSAKVRLSPRHPCSQLVLLTCVYSEIRSIHSVT